MAETDSASSSDSEFHGENSQDLSYEELTQVPEHLFETAGDLLSLQLHHNSIAVLPPQIALFRKLVSLDISNNELTVIGDEITTLASLRTFIARNNHLTSDSLPKEFGTMESLDTLNLSGNNFTDFPMQITELPRLRSLYLGGNKLNSVPSAVKNLLRLELLYLGGNCLTEIPAEVGYLQELTSLSLCDNQLQSLPPTLMHLRRLQSLRLHNNQLSTLPPELVSLNLVELSLRNNPLVVKFVQDLTYSPPSLLELSGRCVKIERIKYTAEDLPGSLVTYLDSAQRCVNPKCKGVYFTSRVEHVKFVDFCGKYRLPLLQYLCSPTCSTTQPCVMSRASSDSETDEEDSAHERMRRVLLG